MFASILSLSPGADLSLNGQPITNNDMARISVYDFQVATSETDTSSALRCQFERTDLGDSPDLFGRFTYFCHDGDGDGPIICPAANPNTIHPAMDMITLGWGNNRAVEDSHRVHYLRRREQTPEEGYFSCHNHGVDTNNDPVGLYILYPSEWSSLLTVIERYSVLYHSSSPPVTEVTAAIEVVSGASTFRVRCSSTGGRALDMAVSGPQHNSVINVEPDGTRSYLGADRYIGRTSVIQSGSNGDVYQCNVTNFASNFSSVTLIGNELVPCVDFVPLQPILSLQLLLQPSLHCDKQLLILSQLAGTDHHYYQ